MDVDVYGDRVRAARILRCVKSVDLAGALGWPPSRQTIIEQSEVVQMDAGDLATLVHELKFPEKFFTERPLPGLTSDDLLFRAPVATTKREKSYLAEFARVVGEMLVWLDSRHRLPPVKLPSLPPATPTAEAARQTRVALGLTADQPISNLTHRLERSGVAIVVRTAAWSALPEKHLGYSTRVGEHGERPLTVLKGNGAWDRMRWTVAHEAGHLVLHGSHFPANAEVQASEFASELLAPAAVIRDELPSLITLGSLTEVKLHWGISVQALIRHLSHHNLISDERRDTLQKQLYTRINPETGRTWGRDEPGRDARLAEYPTLISTWTERCLGGMAPNFVAAMWKIMPADIVAMVLDGKQAPRVAALQRPLAADEYASRTRRKRQRSNTPKSGVVDLDTWRLRA